MSTSKHTAPLKIVISHRDRLVDAYDYACELHRHRPNRDAGVWLRQLFEEGIASNWWPDKAGFAKTLKISHEMATRIADGRLGEIAPDTVYRLASANGWQAPELTDRGKRQTILDQICPVLKAIGFVTDFRATAVDELVHSIGQIEPDKFATDERFTNWVGGQQSVRSSEHVDDIRCAGFYLGLRPTLDGYPGALIRAARAGHNSITQKKADHFENTIRAINRLRVDVSRFFTSAHGKRKISKCSSEDECQDTVVRHLADNLSKNGHISDPNEVRATLGIFALSFEEYLSRTLGQLIERSPATAPIAKILMSTS
jgi:hypothetical protein